MRWTVETVTFLQPPLQIGRVYSTRDGMHPELVTVQCKEDANGAHPRHGWKVYGGGDLSGIDIAPTGEDMAAGAPETGLVAGAAQRAQMQRIQFAKSVIIKNIARVSECDAPTAEKAPEPAAPLTPAIDISKPQPREVLDGMKFFTLQAHVYRLTGLKPANKEMAMKLLSDGNLIAEPVAA